MQGQKTEFYRKLEALRVSNVRVQNHMRTHRSLEHVNGQRSDMQTYVEVSTFVDNRRNDIVRFFFSSELLSN